MAQGGPRDDGFGEIAFATTLVDPLLRAGAYNAQTLREEKVQALGAREPVFTADWGNIADHQALEDVSKIGWPFKS